MEHAIEQDAEAATLKDMDRRLLQLFAESLRLSLIAALILDHERFADGIEEQEDLFVMLEQNLWCMAVRIVKIEHDKAQI